MMELKPVDISNCPDDPFTKGKPACFALADFRKVEPAAATALNTHYKIRTYVHLRTGNRLELREPYDTIKQQIRHAQREGFSSLEDIAS